MSCSASMHGFAKTFLFGQKLSMMET